MAQIVTMGEILVEIMATRIGQGFDRAGAWEGPYPSGAPAIFADQAARSGASTWLFGSVGADAFGRLAVERLRASGVDTGGIRTVPGCPTGIAFVGYQADGSRDFVFTIATSAAVRLDAADLRPEAFVGARFFHVMGSSLFAPGLAEAARRGVALAQAAGAEISFDPNIRKELVTDRGIERTIREILAAADLLLPSEADLHHLLPGRSEAEAARELLSGRCRRVVVKKGVAGSVAYSAQGSITTAAFPATEVDPTGAGDCFGGTLVACLAQGMVLERALTLANAAGALAVGRKGPMEGNSSRAELEAFVAHAGQDAS